MILDGYIQPHSIIELARLLPGRPHVWFRIPELYGITEYTLQNGQRRRYVLNIDTVLIDIEDSDPTNHAVYLSYRHYTPITQAIQQVTFKYLPTALLQEQGIELTVDPDAPKQTTSLTPSQEFFTHG